MTDHLNENPLQKQEETKSPELSPRQTEIADRMTDAVNLAFIVQKRVVAGEAMNTQLTGLMAQKIYDELKLDSQQDSAIS